MRRFGGNKPHMRDLDRLCDPFAATLPANDDGNGIERQHDLRDRMPVFRPGIRWLQIVIEADAVPDSERLAVPRGRGRKFENLRRIAGGL